MSSDYSLLLKVSVIAAAVFGVIGIASHRISTLAEIKKTDAETKSMIAWQDALDNRIKVQKETRSEMDSMMKRLQRKLDVSRAN
jgi:DNA/RNA-binding domain of Phe-tRNA-synthetase-like protein